MTGPFKRGQTNDAIRNVQIRLVEMGYALPKWGTDGNLGDETLGAVAAFMRSHAPEIDPDPEILNPEEIALIEEYHRRWMASKVPLMPVAPTQFFDQRRQSDRKNDHGPRPWSRVTGICLHQTACHLGEKPQRMLTIGAHIVISREGKVFWLHDFDRIVWHGQFWNGSTVGIEMDGLYAGIEGQDWTVWDDPDTAAREKGMVVTPALVAAAGSVIDWIVATVSEHGGHVKNLVSHRQSSKSRRNDPGSALWQSVALPAIKRLGLSDCGPGHEVGGYPIPADWDPSRVGIKY